MNESTLNPVHAKVTPERNDLQLAATSTGAQELGAGTELGFTPAAAPPVVPRVERPPRWDARGLDHDGVTSPLHRLSKNDIQVTLRAHMNHQLRPVVQ